jgi:hypothetical protein
MSKSAVMNHPILTMWNNTPSMARNRSVATELLSDAGVTD